MKKSYGFTLAETLITLGIIGTIAAITLPAINNIRPNNEVVMLKKVYYNVTRIVSELINDEDFYPEREEENQSGFSNVQINDLLGGDQEATFHGYSFSGNSKFCGLFAAKINTRQGGNPNDLCQHRVSLNLGGNFETPDGVTWSMPFDDFNRGVDEPDFETIFVDINGPERGANCTQDRGFQANMGMNVCGHGVGPDRFAINVGRMGNVDLPGRTSQVYVSTTRVNKQYSDLLRENPDMEQ